jgi:hypothetical protein
LHLQGNGMLTAECLHMLLETVCGGLQAVVDVQGHHTTGLQVVHGQQECR